MARIRVGSRPAASHLPGRFACLTPSTCHVCLPHLCCWQLQPDCKLNLRRNLRLTSGPSFESICFDCHGATEKLEGGLDLRLVRFLTQGGESGPAIVPGDADSSYLIERVANGEMPPDAGHVPREKLDLLRRWIADGAPTSRDEPEHLDPGIPITLEERSYWAYQPIQRPAVPEYGPEERVRTPIDALLREAMPAGVSFSPDADRETLIKRVYFDLARAPADRRGARGLEGC